MAMVTRAMRRRRLEEEEEEGRIDRISGLPDAVLGDIVSLLPTKDGARTQVLSSRWRHIWRSAPLNLDTYHDSKIHASMVPRILSAHPGPGRRFCISDELADAEANLDSWLRSPALNNLQELEFLLFQNPLPPLPASVRRFSPTLRVATFRRCNMPESALQLPLLSQLSLVDVRISETSLHDLLAGCPVLETLLLLDISGFPRLQIVSSSLTSIGVYSRWGNDDRLGELIIEDAPCLHRLLIFEASLLDISVISAPRLKILGQLSEFPRLQFGTATFQVSRLWKKKTFQETSMVSLTVVCSVKVLALTYVNLNLDAVINLIKCFSCLEKLYIQTNSGGDKNTWCRKYRNLIGTFDIRLKKIVLSYYQGNKSHVNFAKFFVSNATALESMRFELKDQNVSSLWIKRQHMLLQIEKRASRDAQFYFVSRNKPVWSFSSLHVWQEQVHNLSTADPFERIYS